MSQSGSDSIAATESTPPGSPSATGTGTSSRPGRPNSSSRTYMAIAAVVVILVGSGVAYEVVTSQPAANPVSYTHLTLPTKA